MAYNNLNISGNSIVVFLIPNDKSSKLSLKPLKAFAMDL